MLLVQSFGQPDWSWLGEPGAQGYLLPLSEPNPAVKPISLPLSAGQILAFRLRANPTVKRQKERVGLMREEDQLAWLRRKAEQSGFRLSGQAPGARSRARGDP